jgi:hypothetical protein
MPNADDQFTEVFRRFLTNWSVVTSLRQVAEAGMPYVERVLAVEHSVAVEIISNDPQGQRLFVDNNGPFDPELAQFLRAGMTTTAIAHARSSIDAASVVFAQAMLDDCAWSLHKICAVMRPQDWEPGIDNKQITLRSAREKDYEANRMELIESKIKAIERESLPDKVDSLFRLCPPPVGFNPVDGYVYDRARLEKIDSDRHRVIHSSGYGTPLTNVEDDLVFLKRTASYLIALVNARCGVRIDPRWFAAQVSVPA